MATSGFLAMYLYPEPHGRAYSAEELRDPHTVEEVIDYCQTLEGIISAQGWRFLLRVHALQGLLEINRRSGWFDTIDDGEASDGIKYYCLVAGYDPETDAFGRYDEATGTFVAQGGAARSFR